MNKTTTELMTEANKLIFVKMYEEADSLINSIVQRKDGKYNLQIQLRRIELSMKLGDIKNLHTEYLKNLTSDTKHEHEWQTCVYLAEQHGEFVTDDKMVENFQSLIKNFGPSAAAYFGIGFSMECQNNYERAIYNYEQCIKIDSDWAPAYFGLSQIYYHLNDEIKGDQYFYLFENSSPYSLYGNFETHKELSADFLSKKNYRASEAAIVALSDWWIENRGFCPKEIQIYENFSICRILEQKGDKNASQEKRGYAILLSRQLLNSSTQDENILYFVAKVLEEYSEFDLAFEFYKAVLKNAGGNPGLVQKIGSQFLSMGEFELARELFEEAYDVNPDQSEIRFCLLVSKLKLAKVNVEEYLIGRERLTKLVDSGEDKVELLALLHALLAKFQEDAEVHGHIAEVYLKLGDIDRSKRHYSKMFELDGACATTAIRFASFEIVYGDPERAINILNSLKVDGNRDPELKTEIIWLKAMYYIQSGESSQSLVLLKVLLKQDPWNLAYVSQQIRSQMNTMDSDILSEHDSELDKILKNIEAPIDWSLYDKVTELLRNAHQYEIVYCRQKLRYLYSQNSQNALMNLIRSACKFDARQGVYDFMRLLNTNFDSPDIYYALGYLFKDMWQLETASMWFEQLLQLENLDNESKRKAYLELSDCYIWRNFSINKAIEYVKIAMELGDRVNDKATSILAHGYLKTGQMKEAKVYLEQVTDSTNKELVFLRGLYQYRNGSAKKANELWKPLITIPNDSLRDHYIKEEMLKYYYDGAPYNKATN